MYDIIELISFVLTCRRVFMRDASVQVQESPVYRRDGLNVHSDVFISVAQAILGGTAKAQGLYGPISLVASTSLATHALIPTLSDRRAHFCWYAGSCRLPERPGCPAAGEGHSKDEQLQLRRPLCSHQDQTAKVKPSATLLKYLLGGSIGLQRLSPLFSPAGS